MRPIALPLISSVATSNGITTTQTLSGASNLTINGSLASGGVATFTQPVYVIVTSSGNDSGITWTITGTDANGNALVQTITGANIGAAMTTHRFKTVTQIHSSASAAANVIAGSAAFVYSIPAPVDYRPQPVNIGLAFTTTGATTSFKVQYALEAMSDYADADTYNASAQWYDHASLTSLTAKAAGSTLFPVRAFRLKSDQAGTDTGTLTIVQSGN